MMMFMAAERRVFGYGTIIMPHIILKSFSSNVVAALPFPCHPLLFPNLAFRLFSSILHILIDIKSYAGAITIFKDIPLSMFEAFEVLIERLSESEAGNTTEALSYWSFGLLREMNAKGNVPTDCTYVVVIRGTFNNLMNGLYMKGLLEDAQQLFVAMEESGCEPNETTSNIILKVLVKLRRYDDIAIYLEEMIKQDFGLIIDISVVLWKLIRREDNVSDRVLQKLDPSATVISFRSG
ncbi:OLC1v1012501C1 [Oldenlandia corymbosa var. corymbosa]|uniref:OLC1v1012501C1 n=1 Tax=Oldenlandia corymbosa var. corymbosa TaxID=529605 RepID=A0AAV1DW33_OLDCO|nr:OLC1v1012501C1 [Oldenlandia corymbosa var. corymbosa]